MNEPIHLGHFRLFTIIYMLFALANAANQQLDKPKCINPQSINFSACKLPPFIAQNTKSNLTVNKKILYCDLTLKFLKCMNTIVDSICKNYTSTTNTFINKMNKEILGYNLTYQNYCDDYENILGTSKTPVLPVRIREINYVNETLNTTTIKTTIKKTSTTSMKTTQTPTITTTATKTTTKKKPMKKIQRLVLQQANNIQPKYKIDESNLLEDDECDESNYKKCEPRSLHITCGYPAANPKSNLNAYCNEMKHYIRCAKCKTVNCNTEPSIISIRKHLTGLEAEMSKKCSNTSSQSKTTNQNKSTMQSTTSTTRKSQMTSFYDTTTSQTTRTTFTTSKTTTKFITTSKPTTTTTTSTTLKSSTSSTTDSKLDSIIKNRPMLNKLSSKEQTHSIDDEIKDLYTSATTKRTQQSEVTTTTRSTTATSSTLTTVTMSSSSTSTTIKLETINSTAHLISTNKFIKEQTVIFPRESVIIPKSSILPLSSQQASFLSTDFNDETTNVETTNLVDEQMSLTTTTELSKIQHQNENSDEQLTHKILITHVASSTNFAHPSETDTENLIEILDNETLSPKIDQLVIKFDNIDAKTNTFDVVTSDRNKIIHMKILNRTDVFKGIKNGAVYLHSKTGFILDLNKKDESDFCLTSNVNSNSDIQYNSRSAYASILPNDNIKADVSCANGWTVSFWIKVSNLNLFDKTILKVDNLINNRIDEFGKFFVLKLSNFDMKLQFLFRRKLWTINQNLIWKSEWSMMTFTWNEYEGITVYINEKKLLCQQAYEYYSLKDDYANNKDDYLPSNTKNSHDQELHWNIKRSFSYESKPGVIYIGLNNKLNRFSGRKFFWTYRDDSSQSNQNVLLASSFSEAILIDEMAILNYRLTSKEIAKNYFNEHSIRNDYDSVEEAMFITSTDNKQSEIVAVNGANVKKFRDNWFLTLSGDKQFVIIPNLLDSCILDAENLCTNGFSTTLWIKFTYNFIQYPIEKKFQQILFFYGSQDFSNGIEAILYINAKNGDETNLEQRHQDHRLQQQPYNYVIAVSFKTQRFTLTKHFDLKLNSIAELNNLNCMTIKFGDARNLTKFNLFWLNRKVEEIDIRFSAKINNDNTATGRSYSPYSLSSLGEFGLKASVLSSSNTIGLFGDISKQSYFNIKYFELKNHDKPLQQIEYDFYAANPAIYEFNSLEKLFKMPNVQIIGSPQIVETRFGKSLLFSKQDQKVILSNVSNSCFGDLNLCKNGYTLKLWVCFTNYNNLMAKSSNKKLKKDETLNLSSSNTASFNKNISKKIFILSNGAQKLNRKGMTIIYDLNKNQLIVYIKTIKKWFKTEVNLKLKLYVWYIITVTWDELDGLRLYINNRLLDHAFGNEYASELSEEELEESKLLNNEFTLGKSEYEFDEFDAPSQQQASKSPISFLENQLENQTEDSDRLRKNLNKNKNNNQANSFVNNYYEFIVHKLIQFDVRKYPDEIITKDIIVQEKKLFRVQTSMTWLWYTISGSFMVIGFLSLIILIVIIRKRASNGFWSRENDIDIATSKTKRSKSTLCCNKNANEEDLVDVAKNNFDLELKHCQLNVDNRFHPGAIISCDEYSTNSLYGTIDRLIVKKNMPTCSPSTQSAILYTNNFNSITKDPRMRNSTSYVINAEEEMFEKSEIHF